jgi:hypothetical protein
MPVPGVYHSDPAAKIDETVSVDIRDDGALGMPYRNRSDRRHPAGDSLGPPVQ